MAAMRQPGAVATSGSAMVSSTRSAAASPSAAACARPAARGVVGACVAGLGYRQVCGRADAEGDGITPVETALMPGATHIVLEGVYHTPLGADDANGRCWYGSESVLASWADVALGKSRV